MAIKNFNRIIDIKLTQKLSASQLGLAGVNKTAEQVNFIRCPRKGRKPYIRISGQMIDSEVVSLFELRIKNFYDSKIMANLSEVQVTAGYEDSSSLVFTGTPVNVYTAGPGPDRETVIQCTTASFGDWTGTLVKLQLKEGFTLREAVSQINDALKFDDPEISPALANQTSKTNWDFAGTAKEAVHFLTKIFSNCSAFIMNNRIIVTEPGGSEYVQTFEIPFLSSAPQFSGGMVTLTAPWNPAIKPRDRVIFDSQYFTSENSELLAKINARTEAVVSQIGFDFETTGSTNQMTIQAVLEGGNL